jgi:LytS/YehU family sensor histidine kinase
LIIASVITVIISLFEIRLDPVAMLYEVISNFITCVSITLVAATLTTALGLFETGRNWKQTFLLLLALAVGGILGGLVSWGINDLLFAIHMSHPHIYLMMVAALSIIFGLAFTAYENISLRLEETASRLADQEVQAQKLLRLKTEAELEALRARVNPHFLFNTLNSIASLIPVDPVKAEEVVQRMSNLFRYILSAGDRGLVPLREELDVVGEYLEIEKVRLQGRLDYVVRVDDSLDGAMIPGMLLQPLVENSVKYGVAPKKDGGRIEVRCRRNGDRCSITISDTGEGFNMESTQEGFGISGVRQRLELNYPDDHEFDITAHDGVTIRITIPARRASV